jgi:hypothetical protein
MPHRHQVRQAVLYLWRRVPLLSGSNRRPVRPAAGIMRLAALTGHEISHGLRARRDCLRAAVRSAVYPRHAVTAHCQSFAALPLTATGAGTAHAGPRGAPPTRGSAGRASASSREKE